MRQLQCENCAGDKLKAGRREAMAATKMEPAEWERVVWGVARIPTEAQRTAYFNGSPVGMSLAQFDCDYCSAAIVPGQRVAAWTVWKEGDPEPPAWEDEYLIREDMTPEVTRQ